jgi:hypothetical protein
MEREVSALLSAADEEQWARNGFFEAIDSLSVLNKNTGRSLKVLNDTCGLGSTPQKAINSPHNSLAEEQYLPQSSTKLGRSLPPSPKINQSCFRGEDAKVKSGEQCLKTLRLLSTIPVDSFVKVKRSLKFGNLRDLGEG